MKIIRNKIPLLLIIMLFFVGCLKTEKENKLILKYSGNTYSAQNEIVIEGISGETKKIQSSNDVFYLNEGNYKVTVKGVNINSEEKNIYVKGTVEEEINFVFDNPESSNISKRVGVNGPSISSVNVNGGEVIITGLNFGAYDYKTSSVMYTDKNGILKKIANFINWSDTEIKIAKEIFIDGEYGIYVKSGKNWSNKMILGIGVVLNPNPAISNISTGIYENITDEIVINGSGFESVQGNGKVLYFAGEKAGYADIISWSDTEIKIKNHFSKGTYKIYIKNSHKITWSNGVIFEVLPVVIKYKIEFNGNGNTEGTVPVDTNEYLKGQEVVIPSKGNLAKAGYIFAGWNTEADGRGDRYAEGEKIAFFNANIKLYAKWIELISYGKDEMIESFESGLSKWNLINSVEIIQNGTMDFNATHGEKMVRINTGSDGSFINSGIFLSNPMVIQTRFISFDWVFMSDEIRNYQNSIYNDYFVVRFILESGEKQEVFRISRNEIQSTYALISNYRTEWQNSMIDVSTYMGQKVSIEFQVYDVGDPTVNTSVCIDQIKTLDK